MTTIGQIIKSSNRGYIDDPGEVKRITDRIMEMRMSVLIDSVSWREHAEEVLVGLISTKDIHKRFVREMTFADVIALIGNMNTGSTDTSDDLGCSDADFKRFQTIKLREMVHDTGGSNLLVKQFLGLNVTALLNYLENRHFDRKVYKIGKKLQYSEVISVPGRSDNELNHMQISVGELFEATRRALSLSWIPWNAIKVYEERMLKIEGIEMMVLIDALYHGYRERMHLEDIRRRYDEQSRNRDDFEDTEALWKKEEQRYGKDY